mmetsp:Transcript_37211/g.87535  ORF Transcript_37211/g.87535 Transcript_37211/m.87535 type:complete len:403 (-) Transcript_37211:287-1495(-)
MLQALALQLLPRALVDIVPARVEQHHAHVQHHPHNPVPRHRHLPGDPDQQFLYWLARPSDLRHRHRLVAPQRGAREVRDRRRNARARDVEDHLRRQHQHRCPLCPRHHTRRLILRHLHRTVLGLAVVHRRVLGLLLGLCPLDLGLLRRRVHRAVQREPHDIREHLLVLGDGALPEGARDPLLLLLLADVALLVLERPLHRQRHQRVDFPVLCRVLRFDRGRDLAAQLLHLALRERVLDGQQTFQRLHPVDLPLLRGRGQEPLDDPRLEVDKREVPDVGEDVVRRQHAVRRRVEQLRPRLVVRAVSRQHALDRVPERVRQALARELRVEGRLLPARLHLEHAVLAHLRERLHHAAPPLPLLKLLGRLRVLVLAHHCCEQIHPLHPGQQLLVRAPCCEVASRSC